MFSSKIWKLIAGAGILGILIFGAIWSIPSIAKKANTAPASLSEAKVHSPSPKLPRVNSKGSILYAKGEAEAKRLFLQYANAKKTSDFLSSAYHSKERSQLIEKEWLPMKWDSSLADFFKYKWNIFEEQDLVYGVLEAELPDFTTFQAFFREEEGAVKLDWKATAAYSSEDLDEIRRGEGDARELRVRLSMGDFYNQSFSEKDYRSYRILSPNGESALWAYAKRGSEQERRLSRKWQGSESKNQELKAIIKLKRGSPDSLPNQWLIEEIFSLNWLDF